MSAPGRGGAASQGVAPPRESRESDEHPTPAPSAANERSAARRPPARERAVVCVSATCAIDVCDSRVERGDVFSFIIEFSW